MAFDDPITIGPLIQSNLHPQGSSLRGQVNDFDLANILGHNNHNSVEEVAHKKMSEEIWRHIGAQPITPQAPTLVQAAQLHIDSQPQPLRSPATAPGADTSSSSPHPTSPAATLAAGTDTHAGSQPTTPPPSTPGAGSDISAGSPHPTSLAATLPAGTDTHAGSQPPSSSVAELTNGLNVHTLLAPDGSTGGKLDNGANVHSGGTTESPATGNGDSHSGSQLSHTTPGASTHTPEAGESDSHPPAPPGSTTAGNAHTAKHEPSGDKPAEAVRDGHSAETVPGTDNHQSHQVDAESEKLSQGSKHPGDQPAAVDSPEATQGSAAATEEAPAHTGGSVLERNTSDSFFLRHPEFQNMSKEAAIAELIRRWRLFGGDARAGVANNQDQVTLNNAGTRGGASGDSLLRSQQPQSVFGDSTVADSVRRLKESSGLSSFSSELPPPDVNRWLMQTKEVGTTSRDAEAQAKTNNAEVFSDNPAGSKAGTGQHPSSARAEQAILPADIAGKWQSAQQADNMSQGTALRWQDYRTQKQEPALQPGRGDTRDDEKSLFTAEKASKISAELLPLAEARHPVRHDVEQAASKHYVGKGHEHSNNHSEVRLPERKEATVKVSDNNDSPDHKHNIDNDGWLGIIGAAAGGGTTIGGRHGDKKEDKPRKPLTAETKIPDRRLRYIVQYGDTLELIASRRLGDALFADLILTINRGTIFYKNQGTARIPDLRPGHVLLLPSQLELQIYREQFVARHQKLAEATAFAEGAQLPGGLPVDPIALSKMHLHASSKDNLDGTDNTGRYHAYKPLPEHPLRFCQSADRDSQATYGIRLLRAWQNYYNYFTAARRAKHDAVLRKLPQA